MSINNHGYTFTNKVIGKGSFSSVITAVYEESKSGKKIDLACKIIKNNKAGTEYLEKFLPREIEILAKVDHPNIITIHSILKYQLKIHIFMVYEPSTLLKEINNKINEPQANLWFHQLTSAVKYLHRMGYAHRDLKCENIMISAHRNVKVGDFGFARLCYDQNKKEVLSVTHCGSQAYAAPEILRCEPYDAKKVDIFSMGVVLFSMIVGGLPFSEKTSKGMLKARMDRSYTKILPQIREISPDCLDLIHNLLEPDPGIRFTIDEVYACSWLRKRVTLALSKKSH